GHASSMASAPKTIDISSPYFLGTGDQPGNLISHVILKGDNYMMWILSGSDIKEFRRDRDEEKLHQFYIGIDDDLYGAVHTNLLSQTPSPDLESAYQTFLQEERSRSIARTKPSTVETHAFALTGDRSRQRSNKSHLVCTHCKKRGHDRSGCFVLTGFPDWWIEKYGPPKAPASSSHKGRAHAHHTIGSGLLPLPHRPHSVARPPVTTHGPAAGPIAR
ncbi:Ribonuclease HII, partial [Bienertia sinuspersici]